MAGDPNEQRGQMAERWKKGAAGWAKRADRLRAMTMPLSVWMVERLELQPGQRVLELAAGPGDTGFLAAELVAPGGTLVSSDASPAMLEVARARARRLGITNAEFQELELEWIDLPTASVDAVLCRWGVMLIVDPDTALREMRRVLAPGGRATVAVWDKREVNPWATIDDDAMIELGHAEAPEPGGPGMFALSADGQLAEMLADAGFVEVVVEAVDLPRRYETARDYLDEAIDLSPAYAETYERLSDSERDALLREIERRVNPFTQPDGSLLIPGSSLAALASA